MSDWQPIETAPKDGTEVIGIATKTIGDKLYTYGPWTMAYCNGMKAGWRSSWDECEVIEYMSDFGTDYKASSIMDPTHWMPRPAAPVEDMTLPGTPEWEIREGLRARDLVSKIQRELVKEHSVGAPAPMRCSVLPRLSTIAKKLRRDP